MPESVIEKALCDDCGADVRENSLFCYNCGSSVQPPAEEELKDPDSTARLNEPAAPESVDAADEVKSDAVEDLEKSIKIEPPAEDKKKLAKASADRRKARGRARGGREYTWEPVEEEGNRMLVLMSAVAALVAAVVVGVMVFLK